jgi:hypothetical protein
MRRYKDQELGQWSRDQWHFCKAPKRCTGQAQGQEGGFLATSFLSSKTEGIALVSSHCEVLCHFCICEATSIKKFAETERHFAQNFFPGVNCTSNCSHFGSYSERKQDL